MNKAILHIGTEKTGSTAIQSFLTQNRKALQKRGFLYPKTAGGTSNHKLVLFTKTDPEPGLMRWVKNEDRQFCLQRFREQFPELHRQEVAAFQRQSTGASTVVYSSEHFHSRVHCPDDIASLREYLYTTYDEITVMVYLRRQDRLAMSSHNTALRSGLSRPFSFASMAGGGFYYDYRKLLERWHTGFENATFNVQVFQPDRLKEGNVVADFCSRVGIDTRKLRQNHKDDENRRLSYSARQVLLAFNRLPEDAEVLQGRDKESLRDRLIDRLYGIEDGYGNVMPARREALEYYSRFQADNRYVSDTYLHGQGFDECFDEYPETGDTVPELDTAALLSNSLQDLRG